MYNTWDWHLEMTVIDNIDEYIMESKGMAIFWDIQTLEMPEFVTVNTLITATVRVMIRDATARFNTLLTAAVAGPSCKAFTAAVAGPSHEMNKHPIKTWNKILGLALYCHPCLHTFVFLASQAVFTSYDTTGTVVTQTYLLWYHRNSHRDSGETYNRDSSETYDTTGTVMETVMRHMIPQEQCWDSGGDTKYF